MRLCVNTLWGSLSFIPIPLAVPGNQPPSKMRLSLSQPFLMPLQLKAAVCTATLQAAPARLSLFLLWAITCWRKECGAGQGSLRALLTAPNSSKQGGAWGGFLSGTPGTEREGMFLTPVSLCFGGLGLSLAVSQRGGNALAASWLSKTPTTGKTQRRRVGNNQSPGYFLLLLSSTQIARGCGETERFKTATHGPGCLGQLW